MTRKKRVFSKTGLNKRERQHGLTEDQVYYIFQGIVLPTAIKKEREAKDSGEDLPISASKMAENMLVALLDQYSKYTHEKKLALVRMAKKKYEELLEEIQ